MTFEQLKSKENGWIEINNKSAFFIEKGKVFAFAPKDFKKFKGIHWFDIEELPFRWDEHIPKFRFKIELIKPSLLFFKKYDEYLKTIKIKKQFQFHQYPNALLKNWKNVPKLFDRKNKKFIKYREDFFCLKTNKDQKKLNKKMQFLEDFSIPIENEIINFNNITEPKFFNYYKMLFDSRQLLTTELTQSTWGDENIKDKKLVAEDYTTIPIMRENYIFISISIILQKRFLTNFPYGFFERKIAYTVDIKKKVPLGLFHIGSGQLENGILFFVFPLAQDEFLIVLNKKLEKVKTNEINKKIIEFYINQIILDKRNKFLLVDEDTDKDFIKFLEKDDNVNIKSPNFHVFYMPNK